MVPVKEPGGPEAKATPAPGIPTRPGPPHLRASLRQTVAIAWQLARLDLVRRYTSTMLGLAWATLTPLGMGIVIGVVFSRLFGTSLRDFLPYLFCGLILWSYFAACIDGGAIALIAAEGYIKQIPGVSFFAYPLRMVFAAMVALVMGLVAVVLVALALGRFPTPAWITLLPALLFWGLFGLAVCCASAVVNTSLRDFTYIQTVAVQALFYATPIMYPPTLLADHGLAWMLTFNPVYHLIMLVRTPIVFGQVAPLPHWIAAGLMIGLLLPGGLLALHAARRRVVFWL